jgi:hypothetical protein
MPCLLAMCLLHCMQVLQGQAPVSITVLSSVLDDVYSTCGAVAYDEGLQVVRWGPGSFILLAPIDPGMLCCAVPAAGAAGGTRGQGMRVQLLT